MAKRELQEPELLFDSLTGNLIPVNSVNTTSITNILKAKLLDKGHNNQTRLENVADRLISIATHAEKDNDAISAANAILDRLIGKPKQQVENLTVTATLNDFLSTMRQDDSIIDVEEEEIDLNEYRLI